MLLCCAARAMLMRADIMLLDEPTNHLDVTNVAWLEKYLTGLENVTSMIVSHDSGFLDNVCTDIIHYEDRKLKRYRVRSWALASRSAEHLYPCNVDQPHDAVARLLEQIQYAISGLLDRIIGLAQGNLSEFVKVKPEARTYYDLEASGIKFVLPEPGAHR